MFAKPSDPLLAAAKVIVILAQIVMIFGIVMLGIGLGAILTVGHAELMAEIAASGAPSSLAFAFISFAIVTGAALLFLGYRFFDELRGIIDSVGAGDPFDPLNANRLSRMGWITVAIQLAILPIMGLAMWLTPHLEKLGDHTHIGGGLDISGILLTLILFILARVFSRGAEMREELEGTV